MKIGILGGGQLGRMLALAGLPLGLKFRAFDISPEAPAGQVCELVVGPYEDERALERFAAGLDLVTYEFENIPVRSVHFLAERVSVLPSPRALERSQDRLTEKNFLRDLGIPTPLFAEINSCKELETALQKMGFPAILKTRRLGYDGKGQYVIRVPRDADLAWNALQREALLLESSVPFDRELSLVSVRGRDGVIACYPLVENHHRDGILRKSLAPAPHLTKALQKQAERAATCVLKALQYVGVLTIEFFELHGKLVANEMAPRVHNSGHWTIEGAETSQFENHWRAILGLPLGSTQAKDYSAMINLIGTLPATEEILSVPNAHLHLYGKAPRPGRKLGHLTLCASTHKKREAKLRNLSDRLALE
jgi:5-(carboxyamino)imidazole ribonucleotide synthase